MLETADPVAITVEGQLALSRDAQHVSQVEVRRCRTARRHGARSPGGRALGRSGESYLARAAAAQSGTAEVQASCRPGAGRRCSLGMEGAIGELLRREGLYSSHLTDWRKQRAGGALAGLAAKKRGPTSHKDPLADAATARE